MKQYGLATLFIALLLLLAVQGNAHDVTIESVQVQSPQEHTVATEMPMPAIGSCGAEYGCAVTELPSTESSNHDDLLAELAASLGQDDSKTE